MNAISTENHLKSILLFFAFLLANFVFAQNDCPIRSDYDWDTFDGNEPVIGDTYVEESVSFSFSASGNTNRITGDVIGGTFPIGAFNYPDAWVITQDLANITESNTFTIDFNGDLLYDFCFTVLDIDSDQANFSDLVTVNGIDYLGATVSLTAADYTINGNNLQFNGANQFEGIDEEFCCGFEPSNVEICFPTAIQRIEIVFGNSDIDAGAQNFGIYDFDFCSMDFDGDSTQDEDESDADGDGIINTIEGYTTDLDLDGVPNVYDADFPGRVDANGDNTDDRFDADDDQFPDYLDLDADNDGIPDFVENLPTEGAGLPADTDGDGTDDYLDSDSDDDGVSDFIEGNDIDFNGIADVTALAGTDADDDGIDDNFDTVDGRSTANNNSGSRAIIAASLVDDDDVVDFRDTDDDGDGILTSAEIPDANGDGIPDYISACEDGFILDFENYGVGSTPGPVFTVDEVDITFSFIDPSGGSVDYEISEQIHDPENSVFASQQLTTNTTSTQLKVLFNKPLEGFCFDLLDIDRGAHLDSMAVNIFRDGDVIVLDTDNIIPGRSAQLNSNNFIVGTSFAADDGYDGNVRVCLGQTVDSLVVFYANHTPGSIQYIGLNDFTWCGVDHDYDEILDINDPDDNNDGIDDLTAGGGVDPSLDTDGDRIPDYMDADFAGFTDSNGDGIDDRRDLDLDGVPDHLDKDIDNDGIPNAVELNGGDLPANMDEDGAYPPSYALANDSDGDGRVDDVDDSDGAYTSGTPLANPDTDTDGINDFRDLDSDADGIPDLIEAGGTDADGDGRVDNYSDITGDGFHDDYDPDVFGTTLLRGSISKFAKDTDGDGLADYIDIDADGDGVIDNIEAQTSTGYTAPAGVDTDGDGWDDNYDSDNGGTTPTLPDTDSDASSDYLDTDSDGDGVLDRTESRDSDSDGVADQLASGTDTDSDGLDDAFDPDCSPCGSITGVSAPNQDTDTDSRPDYRDADDDGDGVLTSSEDFNGNGNFADDMTQGGPNPDYLQFTDDPDGDGIPNIADLDDNNDGIPDSDYAACSLVTGNGVSQTNTGVNNAAEALGAPDGTSAQIRNGDNIIIDLNTTVPSDVLIYLTLAKIQTDPGDAGVIVEQSTDGVAFSNSLNIPLSSNTLAEYSYTLNADAQYIRVTRDARGNYLDAVTFTYADCVASDLDGDGIPDQLDLDSDGDGIPNAYEANSGVLPANMDENGQYPSTYASANDSDGDGIVDDVDDTVGSYTAGTALPNNDFDSDGIPDAQDADADGDGIPDSIESVGTDTNANGIPDSFTDTDGDGNPDYRDGDSDGDGVLDLREGQTTAAYIGSPSGVDTDGDGIDDSFDGDCTGANCGGVTGIPITGNDHDSDGTPDFQDTDSDNDGISDLIEANDNNTDGAADITPSGTDANDNGIDDDFDATPVVLQNTDGDSEADWRDNDDDGDGTPTADENVDINPANGTPDYLESNGNTCGTGKVNNGTGYGDSVYEDVGATRQDSALGAPDYAGSGDNNTLLAYVDAAGQYLSLDLEEIVAEGTIISIVTTSWDGQPAASMDVSSSLDGVNFGNTVSFTGIVLRPNSETRTYTVPAGGIRYIRFTWVANTPYIDGLTFTSCADDSDNDGVQDTSDNDSDNDGLTDLQEGNGTDPSADADADGVPNFLDSDFAGYEDANSDGINDNFDQDLDGVPNHQDLDSDNDGIPDAVEANGGSLPANMTAEGAYLSSYVAANDADNDGLATDVDNAGEAGTPLANPDTDNGTGYDDGLPDFLDRDSDNDGITDVAENNGTDNNRDGILDNFVDSDGDGLNDAVDPDNGGTALTIVNSDGADNPDYLDTDSDNDSVGSPGLGDLFEGHDSNFDGTPSWDDDGDLILDTNEGNIDLDGDGILDAFDPNQGGIGAALPNADGDGLPNFRDNDDDDDGTLSSAEDTNGNGNYFDDFTQGQSGTYANVPDYLYNHTSPLPVEFISFKVELKESASHLLWSTAQEINNDRFEIEHSIDGINFEMVGTIGGNGTVNEVMEYTFVHKDLKSGFNYYRLKQIDFDGQYEYSEIKRVSMGAFEDVSVNIFPNPADSEATIQIHDGFATRIELITLRGTILKFMEYQDGTNKHTFDLTDLNAGMYLIRITGPNETKIKRLVVK
ncbi:Por secretion system C-terminal sorting domain-containing protein [Ekhidna lutea]|uniref:Por secretion system C-terminal sorting domain-containing protein n=1 Tax=Ekhidna lutea TaxID=447679 RepID=A0A239H8A5_EKHLU|nr:T9SS type A sorting domain-containing protein [Ekhidna lutea]SNS77375.1 Por secretion system C-terminal sorting domain-containing protein [Ekhidna lutea]